MSLTRADVGMPQWRSEEWARWAGVGAQPTTASRVSPRIMASPRARAVSWRQAVSGIVAFASVAALLWLIPYRVPGELPEAELQAIERPLCASCPASQLITAAGVRTFNDRQWLTVRFAGSPQEATFDVVLGEPNVAVAIAQRPDGGWTMSAPRTSGVALASFAVASRGERAVFELPPLAASGVALRSAEGVRFPAEGVLPVRQEPGRAVNVIDLLVAVVVLAGAWRGYRAGAVPMITQLIALALIVLIIRAISGNVIGASAASSVAAAAVFGAAIAIAGVAVHVILRRIARSFALADVRERGLGALLGMLRAAVVAAMIIAVASDQALIEAVSGTIERSSTGVALATLWRAMLI